MHHSKKVTIISFSTIVLIPVFLLFQGIDFTDTGWLLTYFQNIFIAPESVSFWFHLYLTHIIGGLWNLIFGSLGLLGFKIGAVLIYWLCAYFVFKTYKELIPSKYILPALALGMVYFFADRVTIIHYNNLSLLFLVLTVYFILKGLTKSSWYLFIAGIMVACNTFVRLPNILTGLLIATVIFNKIRNQDAAKDTVKDISICFSGFFAGVLGILLMMTALGHNDLYFSSLSDLFQSTDDELSHYSSFALIKLFIYNMGNATVYSLISIIIMIPLSLFFRKMKTFSVVVYNILVVLFISISILIYIFIFRVYDIKPLYLMGGVILYTSLAVLFCKKKIAVEIRTIALMSIISIATLSIGSDTGIKVGSYAYILGFPIFIWFLSEQQVFGRDYKSVMQLLILFFISISIPLLYFSTYRDAEHRLTMNQTVSHPLLKGIKTTEPRAMVIDELFTQLDNMEIPNDSFLCFESIGMLHYLTGTKPYLSNPWPLLETPGQLEYLLDKKEQDFLPVIVMAKKQTRSGTWPESGDISQRHIDIKNRKIVEAFIEKHQYTEYWSNDMFVILKPGR